MQRIEYSKSISAPNARNSYDDQRWDYPTPGPPKIVGLCSRQIYRKLIIARSSPIDVKAH